MGRRITPPSDSGPIENVDLREALEERYLAYALSTIMHRALPRRARRAQAVHRRLLYAMQQLRLSPQGEFRKCAKIVGDTMGNFHPHGNQAIYDALARLAQDFSVRYPLIDGQGNFGNIDGDNPAADRYTEARLTAVAAHLLDGIDEDTVDFRANYDGREQEPSVLPAAFPNLLANGASGIAVGMATNIPPHNAGELCDAALHLIKFPNATADKLVDFVPGPDLPTGGVIVEPRAEIVAAYKTGAAASASAPAGRKKTPGAAPIRSSSPRFRIRSRRRVSSPASPSSYRRSCRCSPMSATNPPRTSASCSSRRAAASMRSCSWNRCSS